MKNYVVRKTDVVPGGDGDWDGEVWGKVEALKVDNFMGEEPEHKPGTACKLLYDDENLYVIFKVDDEHVLASAGANQQGVCQDSCVEFFFTPGVDISKGYLNVEVNCGGTVLLRHQLSRGVGQTALSHEDLEGMEIYHSEEKIVLPERHEKREWVVEYKLGFDMISKYCPADKGTEGVEWRANFYKCADASKYPHWLTWNVVDRGEPDFHVPECFGRLVFGQAF